MFVYNAITGNAVNLDRVPALFLNGSGSAWGIGTGDHTIAVTGTYTTEAAARAAIEEILDRAGWIPVP